MHECLMDTPRLVLLIFLLTYLFASPDNHRPTVLQQQELEYLITLERQALDLFNSTSYGDFDVAQGRWVNLTGLRQNDSYAWDLLPRIQERVREQQRDILNASPLLHSDHSSQSIFKIEDGKIWLEDHNGTATSEIPWGCMYENVTGIVRGDWVRSRVAKNYTPPELNLTSLTPEIVYSTDQFKRNITGREGKLRIKLEEMEKNGSQEAALVREIRAEIVIKDENSSGDGWEMTLYGIHYLKQGGILLATTSRR